MQKDGLTYLVRDHRLVSDLLKQAIENPSLQHVEKRNILMRISKEVSMHSGVEEMHLYPLARNKLKNQQGDQIADHSLREHLDIKNLLYKLENMDASRPEFDSNLRDLRKSLDHHVQEEEQKLFPALRSVMSMQELEQLEETLDKGKSMAPTHPHPSAPDKPPMNYMNVGAAMADRAYDAMTGRK